MPPHFSYDFLAYQKKGKKAETSYEGSVLSHERQKRVDRLEAPCFLTRIPDHAFHWQGYFYGRIYIDGFSMYEIRKTLVSDSFCAGSRLRDRTE